MARTPRKTTTTPKRTPGIPATSQKHSPGTNPATTGRGPVRKSKATGPQRAATPTTQATAAQKLLAEREAELAVINSIQRGLAAKLGFQAIVDLVGDKMRDVFRTGDMGIVWYDPMKNELLPLYAYEHGVRLNDLPPGVPSPGGPWERISSLTAGRWSSTVEPRWAHSD